MADEQEPEAFTPTSLPAGITLQNVLAALAAQSSPPSSAAPTPAELDSLTSQPFTADLVSSTQHNTRAILCLLCSTIILNPLAALHNTTTNHTLPPYPTTTTPTTTTTTTTTIAHSWVVEGQMSFENVGVTRGVEGGVRYLVCGNCDGGPIGCVYADAPQTFYVVHGRIRYK